MSSSSCYAGLVYKIIGAAMEVHNELNYGLLEAIYKEALHYELEDANIPNDMEVEIRTFYKKRLLNKKYRMDIVAGDVIVELKSVSKILPAHRAQLCNYLRLTKKPVGLLINFGEPGLIGERWFFDAETNQCFIVDKNMCPLAGADYKDLLYMGIVDEEDAEGEK